MTLAELARRVRCAVEGDASIEVTGVASLDNAEPSQITFLADSRHAKKVRDTRASAIIADSGLGAAPCPILRTSNPRGTLADVLAVLGPGPERPPSGIDPLANVHPSAVIPEDVAVSAFVCIGAGVRIGSGTVLFPHVVIGRDVVIGSNCIVHAHVSIRERVSVGNSVVLQDGAVVGSDGFGLAPFVDGTYKRIPQIGTVFIEDDVEIGAHTAIDRPAIGETRVCRGAKIDNLVQLGHGVKVGENAVLCAQVGIAGSTTIGAGVILAGQVGVGDHLIIGGGAKAAGQSGITSSIPPAASVAGYPAVNIQEWRKVSALLRRLPALFRRLRRLEEAVVLENGEG